MTEIAFHVNAPDKLAYACRLLRKAAGTGKRVLVTGTPEQLAHLDTNLWSFSALEFVPHCRDDAPESVVRRSPVLLAAQGDRTYADRQVRVHLGGPISGATDAFERVIEVVGQDEQDRHDARSRWKQYLAGGFTPSHHDITAGGRPNA